MFVSKLFLLIVCMLLFVVYTGVIVTLNYISEYVTYIYQSRLSSRVGTVTGTKRYLYTRRKTRINRLVHDIGHIPSHTRASSSVLYKTRTSMIWFYRSSVALHGQTEVRTTWRNWNNLARARRSRPADVCSWDTFTILLPAYCGRWSTRGDGHPCCLRIRHCPPACTA